jgi:hypothetical protein
MLEHFKDFTREMCRVSKEWVLILQPDPSSLVNLLKQLLGSFVIRFYREGQIYSEVLV